MTILDFLYEEYLGARLAEMRRQLFLRSRQNDKLSDAESTDRDRATSPQPGTTNATTAETDVKT